MMSGYEATPNSPWYMYFLDQNKSIFRTRQMHHVGWCLAGIFFIKVASYKLYTLKIKFHS